MRHRYAFLLILFSMTALAADNFEIPGIGETVLFSYQPGSQGLATLTKRLDGTSPHLLIACATGQHIKEVVIAFRSGSKVIRHRMEDVIVAADSHTAGRSTLERVTLRFSKLRVDDATSVTPTGAPTAARISLEMDAPATIKTAASSFQLGAGVQRTSGLSIPSGRAYFQHAAIAVAASDSTVRFDQWRLEGRVLPKVVVNVDALRYELFDVVVSGYSRAQSMDTITLRYGRIKITTPPAPGSTAKPAAGWDLKSATKV